MDSVTVSKVNMVTVAEENPVSDFWLSEDKADHLICSAFLVGFGYYAARQEFALSDWAARNSSLGFSFGLGIAKELYDWQSKKGRPSYKDLFADMVGVGIGFLFISLGD